MASLKSDPAQEERPRSRLVTKERGDIMELESTARRIHSYDVRSHRIACGVPGQMNSTKHASGVNCPECLKVLADERDRPEPELSAPTTH